MNCVSYTRATNCLPERGDAIIPVMDQNAHIRKYISSRKWKLMKKYSDRKHDPDAEDAFLEMREDGVNRKFDCIVIDSMFQCGRDAFQATALFRKTFYPAGIQFAVVEDDFCSADASPEEVEAYLDAVWGKYHGRHTAERIGRHTECTPRLKSRRILICDMSRRLQLLRLQRPNHRNNLRIFCLFH